MIREYAPVIIQIIAAFIIAAGALITSMILGKVGRKDSAKNMPYECGKNPVGTMQPRFSVKFYIVAMIFILFDIEVIFMYPWAVSYADMIAGPLGIRMLWTMLSFVLIVEIAHLYAYKKGVFDWNKAS
jgi:NADH-quinone oxidoreductase subunit A